MHLRFVILFAAVAGFIVMWSGDHPPSMAGKLVVSPTLSTSEASGSCGCGHAHALDEAEDSDTLEANAISSPREIATEVAQETETNRDLVPMAQDLELPDENGLNTKPEFAGLPVPANLQQGTYRVVSNRGDVRLLKVTPTPGKPQESVNFAVVGQGVALDGTRWHFIRLNDGVKISSEQDGISPAVPSQPLAERTQTIRFEFHISFAPSTVPVAPLATKSPSGWRQSLKNLATLLNNESESEPIEAPRPREARLQMAGELPPKF